MANEPLSNSGAISEGGNIEDKELSKESIIDILGEEDETSSKDDEEKDERAKESEEGDEDEEKGDEEKEDEIKLKDEEGEEEEVELVTPFKKRELLKKYPTILKEFPYLEKAYYRDAQFTEVFATPSDAKEAAEKLQVLDNYERDLGKGNSVALLKGVKEADSKAFLKLVDNYMDNLREVDADAHIHVVSGIVKNLVLGLAREAKKTDNDELRKAAIAVNRWAFDSDDYTPHVKLSGQTEEQDEIANEREQWVQERFESTRDDLDNRVTNVLKSTITQHIDPREIMTDYVRDTAIEKAMNNVVEILDKDASFRRHLDSLWKKAFDTKFSKQSVDAIKSAYLSKAKTVLRPVIQKARNDALKGLGKRVREEREEPRRERQGHSSSDRSSASSSNRGQKGDGPKKGETTLEFLSRD